MKVIKIFIVIVSIAALVGIFRHVRNSSPVEGVDIKMDYIDINVSMSQRTQKTEKGIYSFRPDLSKKPSGFIEISYTINEEPKSFRADVADLFTLGGDYLYYLFECDDGNAFQNIKGLAAPFVKSLKEFKKLNLNTAKRMYRDGDAQQQELAVWMIWKIEIGKDVVEIVEGLVGEDAEKRKQSAQIIGRTRLYHPLINQAVQERLRELRYKPGPVDGVLSDQMIEAVKQYQKAHNIEQTGWLGGPTLERMFVR